MRSWAPGWQHNPQPTAVCHYFYTAVPQTANSSATGPDWSLLVRSRQLNLVPFWPQVGSVINSLWAMFTFLWWCRPQCPSGLLRPKSGAGHNFCAFKMLSDDIHYNNTPLCLTLLQYASFKKKKKILSFAVTFCNNILYMFPWPSLLQCKRNSNKKVDNHSCDSRHLRF